MFGPYSLAFGALASSDATATPATRVRQVWDMRTKKLKFDLPGHADEVYAVRVCQRGGVGGGGGRRRSVCYEHRRASLGGLGPEW